MHGLNTLLRLCHVGDLACNPVSRQHKCELVFAKLVIVTMQQSALSPGKLTLSTPTVSLQEATELSQLFQSIEAAFAASNFQKIADMLATMRRSLKLVGNVPEFSGGMEKLQARGTCVILGPQDKTTLFPKSAFPAVQLHSPVMNHSATVTYES